MYDYFLFPDDELLDMGVNSASGYCSLLPMDKYHTSLNSVSWKKVNKKSGHICYVAHRIYYIS